mgnify:CR=1 FL=1
MLLSTPIGCAPSFLSGFGAVAVASVPIAKLQGELHKLAEATHNPAIDPKEYAGLLVNGLPTDKTMAAVAAAHTVLNHKLPSWASFAISVALGLGASTTQAKTVVLQYAEQLRLAAIAATISAPYYTKPPEVVAPETPSIFATTGPWYKTWWGIGAMVVGGVGVISLITARRE